MRYQGPWFKPPAILSTEDAREAAERELAVGSGIVVRGKPPQSMDNPPAAGAPRNWRWGYLPCGCRNDGYGRHVQ